MAGTTELSAVVERCKREILDDIASGRVPAGVSCFAELHDHVDANEYGGACEVDPECGWPERTDAEMDAWLTFWGAVQAEVDAWLRAGRPGTVWVADVRDCAGKWSRLTLSDEFLTRADALAEVFVCETVRVSEVLPRVG